MRLPDWPVALLVPRRGCWPVLNRTRFRILLLVLIAAEEGRPCPTYEEIVAALGVKNYCVQKHVMALRREGLIAFERKRARTLRPTCRFIPASRLGKESP